jgi:sugar lactone lactonase YvrE
VKRLLITLALATALLALLVAPPLAGAKTLFQPTVVTNWDPAPYGIFAESMAADSHGDLFVSSTTWGYFDEYTADPNIGDIWKVTQDGTTRVGTIDLTPYGMLVGVAIDRSDRVYVGVIDFAPDYGLPRGIGSGVFRLDAGGKFTRVASLPDGTWPNGLAFHKGRLYITDSVLGAVWRVNVDDGVASPMSPWFQSSLLAPADATSLGVNGLAFKGNTLYTVVYDTGRIVKVPLRSNGEPGTPSVLCRRPELQTGDGIAFDVLGRLWVVTNGSSVTPDGGLWRVASDGDITRMANDPGWLNYPSMPVFGRTPSTATTLYILNGAYYDFVDGSAPDLISLQVGVPGLPLR